MINKTKVLTVIIMVIFLSLVIINLPTITKLIVSPTGTYTVSRGELTDEETKEAIVIRDEVILSDGTKEVKKIADEGKKVRVKEIVARYYSEEDTRKLDRIKEIDDQIYKEFENNKDKIKLGSNTVLDEKIENLVLKLKTINDIERQKEVEKEIEYNLLKKIELSEGYLKENTLLKNLMTEKEQIEKSLSTNEASISTKTSGYVSYRIDGYENTLKLAEINNITEQVFEDVKLKVGDIVVSSNKNVKVINDYKVYLAVITDSEQSKAAKVNKKLELRIDGNKIVDAKITNIKELENNKRLLIFEVNKQSETLLQYRKFNVNIIWWSSQGLKVNKSSIVKINDIDYILKDKNGFTEVMPIKIKRETSEYSLIESMTKADFEEKGITNIDYIPKLQEYDVIVTTPEITVNDVKEYQKKE